MVKWIGPAAWSAKEARVGDRLPYERLIDESTVLLRDGSVMSAIQVPGLLFETEDSDALNAHAATREVVLRSTLDARFVLYHHVIRRRVEVELDAEFPDALSRHIDARWKQRLAGGSLFINDQFVTLIRRPARGKTGLPERIGKFFSRQGKDELEADPKDLRSLKAAVTGLTASLSAYGAAVLGDYAAPGVRAGPIRKCSNCFRRSTMARCARCGALRPRPISATCCRIGAPVLVSTPWS